MTMPERRSSQDCCIVALTLSMVPRRSMMGGASSSNGNYVPSSPTTWLNSNSAPLAERMSIAAPT